LYSIIANFGDDSIALIQWAYANNLTDVHILYVHTGWQAERWQFHCDKSCQWVKKLGFISHKLKPEYDFSRLVEARKFFPSQQFHWCAAFLKGITILQWLDENDENLEMTILLANRRSMSESQFDLPYEIKESERYDGRTINYPIYNYSKLMRDELIKKTPFIKPLGHRSLECQPCIHFIKQDVHTVSLSDIKRIQKMEGKLGKTMFEEPFTEYLTKRCNSDKLEQNYYDEFAKSCSWDYGCGL
jgi:hypothetical protein